MRNSRFEARNPRLEIRKSGGAPRPAGRFRQADFLGFASKYAFLVAALGVALFSGCGAPGEPSPRTPPVPLAVADLTAHQLGDAVVLTFSMPSKTIRGQHLADAPSVEILRGHVNAAGAPDTKSFQIVYTIPSTLVKNYLAEDKVRFPAPVDPKETLGHSGQTFAYSVRTRVSPKRSSQDSNIVTVRVFPVAEPISSVPAKVTEHAIELSWPAPDKTSGGEPLGQIAEYHIYRGELDPQSAEAAIKDRNQARWIVPFSQIGSSKSVNYADGTFEFGKTYLYVVRTITSIKGGTVESGDSVPAIVTPRDIFPPGPPQNVEAVVLPGAKPGAVEIDLSWAINPETDLAGYRVYRSEQQGARGQLVTSEVLLSPAYRDISIGLGKQYWYTVTAVDRSGNESAPSATVVVEVPQP